MTPNVFLSFQSASLEIDVSKETFFFLIFETIYFIG